MNTMVKNTVLAPFNALYAVSPELCLKALFRIKQGYALDLLHPKTFSEKIQWIKLYDHNPLMPRCASSAACTPPSAARAACSFLVCEPS